MPSKNINYTTRDGELFDGYLSKPEGDGPFPGIVLITAIFGTDREMMDIADQWAADGFIVSVPDIFWRVLSGPTRDVNVALDRYKKFDVTKGMQDIEDVLKDLKARPDCNGKVGMIGYCFGGRYVHLSAARLGIDAGAAYHGTKIEAHLDETAKVTCPVTFHFGGEDPATPKALIDKIKASYAGHANAEIVVHSGAKHGFAMLSQPGYQQAACVASRAATLRIFRNM